MEEWTQKKNIGRAAATGISLGFGVGGLLTENPGLGCTMLGATCYQVVDRLIYGEATRRFSETVDKLLDPLVTPIVNYLHPQHGLDEKENLSSKR